MARVDRQLPQQPFQERRSRTSSARLVGFGRSHTGQAILLAALVLITAAYIATYYWAEGLWFAELNYLSEFLLRSRTQLALGLTTLLLSLGIAFYNLNLANKLQINQNCLLPNQENLRVGLGLKTLLATLMALGILLSSGLFYHLYLSVEKVRTVHSAVPAPFGVDFELDWALAKQLAQQPVGLAIVAGGAIAIVTFPRSLVRLGAAVLSVCFSIIAVDEWARVLRALDPSLFNQVDPVFGQDLGYYIFKLPLLELINFWISGLLLYVLCAVLLLYVMAGNTFAQGRFAGFSSAQQRHLYAIAATLLIFTSMSHWLDRFELLYSEQGVTYGASFTDIHVDLPVNSALSLIALALALFLIWRTIFWPKGGIVPVRGARGLRFVFAHPIMVAIAVYLLFVLAGNTLVPWLVQRIAVQPNELVRETPYIERTIALSRDAFGLTDIETKAFDPQGTLTTQSLKDNDLTVRNIRLWDTRPLLDSNRQLQQIRLYYEFADADVDRYNLIDDNGGSDRRQVLISARELNYKQVPAEAQTWVNEHLTYTHGYGFTMSPVNTAGPSGLPEYFIKDIAHTPSTASVARSIPVNKPRIYYGELTNTYVMTDTRVAELDYPSGSENVYNRYDGQGGINIGSFWKRLLYAKHLGDWKMLLSDEFTPETRLMFRRNIKQRVARIAPFLQFDGDPYLVVADADDAYAPAGEEYGENYMYWMVDAYTTSDRYPYSDPGQYDFNYIRNSVKVVVDAYNGSVHFYVADEADPMIRTWAQIFPNMFEPLQTMPPALLSHIRYPQDFSLIQSNQLLTYHMTDPQVFYNREDQWRAPNEIYANEEQVVEPYYLIMELPGEKAGEFVLLRPFTPAQRNNLVAWLAARSDGEQYGRQLLYQFPKQELVFGPEQIEARINQEPEISQRISLWNTQGSRANQGNLLVIPIEDSLLYVEPLYLEAEQNRLPILARVIVAYKNRIAMAETLEQGLEAIFNRTEPSSPAIIRELDESDETDGVEQLLLPSEEVSTPLVPPPAGS
ncbi:MAG: UPF0182 family protein [Cyanobacteria bacterium J06597_16]